MVVSLARQPFLLGGGAAILLPSQSFPSLIRPRRPLRARRVYSDRPITVAATTTTTTTMSNVVCVQPFPLLRHEPNVLVVGTGIDSAAALIRWCRDCGAEYELVPTCGPDNTEHD